MKITRLESFTTVDVGFVRVTCEDGSQGWGQLSPYNADITATVFHRQVARWAIGEDALAIDELVATIGEREHKFPGSYLCRALTGLDHGPDMSAFLPLIGRDRALERLRQASETAIQRGTLQIEDARLLMSHLRASLDQTTYLEG